MTEDKCQRLLVARHCNAYFSWLSLWNLLERHVEASDPRDDNSEITKVSWLQARGGGEGKETCGDVKPAKRKSYYNKGKCCCRHQCYFRGSKLGSQVKPGSFSFLFCLSAGKLQGSYAINVFFWWRLIKEMMLPEEGWEAILDHEGPKWNWAQRQGEGFLWTLQVVLKGRPFGLERWRQKIVALSKDNKHVGEEAWCQRGFQEASGTIPMDLASFPTRFL